MIGKHTNSLVVLSFVLVKRVHSQLIIPDQFQRLASIAAALRRFRVNPQIRLAKCGLSKVKQFDIVSVGMDLPRSRARIFQVKVMDNNSFDNRIPLGDL